MIRTMKVQEDRDHGAEMKDPGQDQAPIQELGIVQGQDQGQKVLKEEGEKDPMTLKRKLKKLLRKELQKQRNSINYMSIKVLNFLNSFIFHQS